MKISRAAPLIITLVAWVCWLVPLEGKKHAPSIFGTNEFQWLFAVIVAILIPIAVLLGLRMLATLGHRRNGLWIIYFACAPLIANLVIYGVGGVLMARSHITLTAMHERDAEHVTKLTKAAQTMESADRRLLAAKILYSDFGYATVWRNKNNEYEQYAPDKDDALKVQKNAETNTMLSSTKKKLDWQLRQLPWLFGLDLGAFVLIVFSGLTWHAYRKTSEQCADGKPPSAAQLPHELNQNTRLP